MFSINTLRRLPVALALAGAVCAFAVPQALAGGTPSRPDVFERYAASHPYGKAARTPQRVGVPLYTPAMLAAHFNREDRLYYPRPSLPTVSRAGDRIVDDSFRDPIPVTTPAGERIVDDSFRDAPTVVASPRSGDGLDWGDWGIGIGTGLGLALILGGGLLMGRHLRHRGIQTA